MNSDLRHNPYLPAQAVYHMHRYFYRLRRADGNHAFQQAMGAAKIFASHATPVIGTNCGDDKLIPIASHTLTRGEPRCSNSCYGLIQDGNTLPVIELVAL